MCSCNRLASEICYEIGYYYLYEDSKENNVYSQVIYCKNTESNDVSCERGNGIKDGYVINGADKTKLLTCSETNSQISCYSIDDPSKTNYYINVSEIDENKLIKCNSDSECETMAASVGCYINGDSNNSLISCTSSSSCKIITGNAGSYYLDGSSKSDNGYSKLIYCSGESNNVSCTSKTFNNGYVINGADTTKLIKCSDNNCISTDGSESGKTKYYINSGSDSNSKKLIECSSSSCSTVTASTGYYANSSKNLIYCRDSNNCNGEVSGTEGKYYINNGQDKGNNKLIYCSSTSCIAQAALETDGYYLHGGANNLSKVLIHCSNKSSCEGPSDVTVPDGNYNYYINNGSVNGKNKLIECSSSKCSTVAASAGYYLNLGKKLINCTGDNSCGSPSEISVDANSFKYFINNGKDNNNTAKKFLIECSSSSCSTKTASSNNGYYYLHGGTAGTSSSDALITCNSSGCGIDNNISIESSTYRYYFNNGSDIGTKKLIECSSSKCSTVDGLAGYYLNIVNNLIYCSDNNNCNNVVSGSVGKYYINNGKDNTNNKLIYCTDTCATIAASNNDGYYLHGGANNLYKALIHCSSTSSCDDPSDVTLDAGNYMYYLNNGSDNGENKLIECFKNEGSEGSCSTIVASPGYYLYLDKKLIKCNADKSCVSTSEISVSSGSFKYFINNGKDKENSTKKLLIECSSSSCSTKIAYSDNGYYLHGGTAGSSSSDALIKCDDSGCEIDSSISVESSTYRYYFNNGSDNTNSNKKLIECSNSSCSTVDGLAGYYLNTVNKLIYCSENNKCNSVVSGNEGKYYINNGQDKGDNKLIYCTDTTCATIAASNNDGYYLHGGANKLSKALIHCSSTSSCDDPSDVTIAAGNYKYYLNNGLDNENNKLIECSSSSCSTKTASSNNGYYIHGGTAGSSSSDALISCNDGGCRIDSTISVESFTYRYYFNNGSDNGTKKLIECSSSSCSTVDASTGYYLNSQKYLIKCNGDNGCDSPSEISVSAGLFKYFINNGKDKDNETKKLLIECSNSGCTTIVSSPNGYYIHGGTIGNNLSDALIICDYECRIDSSINDESSTYGYYLNNGSDKESKQLIQCLNGSCFTIDKSIGYYIKLLRIVRMV